MNDSNQGANEHVIRAVQSGGNEKLLGAKEALKERLMRAVMEQAIHEMGEPATIARTVMTSLGPEIKAVSATSQILKQLLMADIERATSDLLSDPDATAEELFGRVKGQWSEPESIRDALRERILADTAKRAVDSLGSSDDAASELMNSGRVPDNNLDDMSSALKNQILEEVARRSTAALENRDAVAATVFSSLGNDHSVVVETSLALEVLIREEIKRQAEASLGNNGMLAQQVYESLDGVEDKVREVARTVADRVVGEIADNVSSTIAKTNELANDANRQLDNRDESVEAAIRELTSAIVSQIAERTQADLAKSDEIARRVMDHLENNQNALGRLTSAAKERVLADVVNNAIAELSDDLGTGADGIPPAQPKGAASESDMGSIPGSQPSYEAQRVKAPAPTFGAPVEPEEEMPVPAAEASEISDVEDVVDARFSDSGEADQAPESAPWNAEDADGGDGDWSTHSPEPRSDRPASGGHKAPVSPSDRTHGSGFGETSWTKSDAGDAGPKAMDSSFDTGEQVQRESSHFVVEEISFDDSEDVFTAFRDDDGGGDTATEARVATETAVYVYGIANGSAASHNWPEAGMDDEFPVRTIAHKGLHAIVSDVRASEYTGQSGEANMKRVDWLKDRARRHAVILESMNLGDTFVPMRFCSVMSSDDQVEAMLRRDHGHYRGVIDRVKGAEEWSVRVYRDLGKLEDRVRASDRKVEDSLGVISQGVVNFVKEEMQRIDKMGGEAVELITDHCVRRSHAALLECARDGVLKPVIADETGGDIILSAAYLVDSGNDDRVRDEIERLGSEYEELGFRFELSGPWPPYHFVGGASPDSAHGEDD